MSSLSQAIMVTAKWKARLKSFQCEAEMVPLVSHLNQSQLLP